MRVLNCYLKYCLELKPNILGRLIRRTALNDTPKTADAPRRKSGRPRGGAVDGREAILGKAIPAFSRLGYEAVNLRDLAREAGVNPALAIYHFGSKSDLWVAAVARLVEWMAPRRRSLAEIAESGAPYRERLEDFYREYVRVNAEIPDYGLFILQEAVRPSERQAVVRERLIMPSYLQTRPLLEEGMRLGVIPEQDPTLLFFMTIIPISNIFAGSSMVDPLLQLEARGEDMISGVFEVVMRCLTGQAQAGGS